MTTVLEVYEGDDLTTSIDTVDAGQWARVRSSVAMALGGGGELVVPAVLTAGANPARGLLTPGRVVRVLVDGVFSGWFVIEQPDDEPLSPDEESGEATSYKGREPVAVALDKVQWQPDRGFGVLPYSKDRYLHWAANRYRDDDVAGPNGLWPIPGVAQLPEWDTANWFGRGAGYVDTAGPTGTGPHFVGPVDSRIDGAPGGKWYGRQRDEIDDDYDAVLVQALADDTVRLFVNGYPLLRREDVYKGQCVQGIIPLSAGDCLVAWECENLNELRTGVAFAIWSIVDGLVDTCLMRSDASKARILGYPSKDPGFTDTEILRLFVDEANDRGMLPDVDTFCDFLSAVDTAGTPMTETSVFSVKAPGDSGLTTARMLTETRLDLSGTPDGLVLQAWRRGDQGEDKTATVQFGKGNCASLRYGYDFAEHATVALVTYEGGAPFEVIHPDEADLGRIEVPLPFDTDSKATARQWARAYLDTISSARRSIELALVPGVGAVPHDDFGLGDWISVGDDAGWLSIGGVPLTIDGDPLGFGDGEPVRVAGIGLEVGPDSLERWTVELEQPKVLIEERLGNIMRRQTGPGRTILPTTTEPSFASNGSGSESTETWSAAALGEVVLTKNGTPITGATLAASGAVTLTDAARKCATGDLISFTVDGTDGFPAGWPVPSPGAWLQHLTVEQDTGTTITLAFTTGVQ